MNATLRVAARAADARGAASGDHYQLADRRRPFADRDHDRLRADRNRGDRLGCASWSRDPYLARAIATRCWRTSIISTATARCSTGWRARTRTTSSRATPTSCRLVRRSAHHRAPEHDLLQALCNRTRSLATKLHALTLTGGEYQTHDYYMNIGPLFADPLARQLYAEIASVESQHITHYGIDAESR